jgi:AcrR family transcriptional regulator
MGRPPKTTREKVLRAAREAFSAGGFAGTTLAEIGARVGVSPAALLRHAPTKQALFREALSAAPDEESLPIDFLPETEGSADPRMVLRRIARAWVPYFEEKMAENIARWMHARSEDEARAFRLPFDPRSSANPPARFVAEVEAYLRRATQAGKVSLRDPRAAALAYLGALHAFVFFHRVLRIDPPIALERYIETLLDIWAGSGIRSPARRRQRGRGTPRSPERRAP